MNGDPQKMLMVVLFLSTNPQITSLKYKAVRCCLASSTFFSNCYVFLKHWGTDCVYACTKIFLMHVASVPCIDSELS